MSELLKHVGTIFQASVMLLVFSIGLHATWSDLTYMSRHPGQLARSVVARNLLMPGFAALVVVTLDLAPAVKAALFAVSIAAVPPFLPATLLKAGGRVPYVIGVLASQSLLAVLFIPLSIAAFNAVLGTHAHFTSGQILPIVATLTLIPLVAGVALKRFAPVFAARIARSTHALAVALLILSIFVVMPGMWRGWSVLVGDGTLAAIVLVAAGGILIGHLLGGPRHDDRTSLALATVSSNPALAIAILSTNVPALQRLGTAAVLLYLVVQLVVAWPYTHARRPASDGVFYRVAERRSIRRAGPDRRRIV